jgi:hypothetical protein
LRLPVLASHVTESTSPNIELYRPLAGDRIGNNSAQPYGCLLGLFLTNHVAPRRQPRR